MMNFKLSDVKVHFENRGTFFHTNVKNAGKVLIKEDYMLICFQNLCEESGFSEFVTHHINFPQKRKYQLGIRIEEKSSGKSWMIKDGNYSKISKSNKENGGSFSFMHCFSGEVLYFENFNKVK